MVGEGGDEQGSKATEWVSAISPLSTLLTMLSRSPYSIV